MTTMTQRRRERQKTWEDIRSWQEALEAFDASKEELVNVIRVEQSRSTKLDGGFKQE